MQIHWLTGTYASTHERQEHAAALGCELALDLHFNSYDDPSVKGGQCFYKTESPASKKTAEHLSKAFADCGLPLRRDSEQQAKGSRASFIEHYQCPAVLLEPLFLSNAEQAAWLHEPGNIDRLAQGLAARLREVWPDSTTIGLSIGHTGSGDKEGGASCVEGDVESAHGRELATRLAAQLTDAA